MEVRWNLGKPTNEMDRIWSYAPGTPERDRLLDDADGGDPPHHQRGARRDRRDLRGALPPRSSEGAGPGAPRPRARA